MQSWPISKIFRTNLQNQLKTQLGQTAGWSRHKLGEISGSHSDKYENGCLLRYCTMQPGRNWLTFQRFLLPSPSELPPWCGGSKNLWNIGKLLPDYMAQHPRRQSSSYSLLWEPEILPNCMLLCYLFLLILVLLFYKHASVSQPWFSISSDLSLCNKKISWEHIHFFQCLVHNYNKLGHVCKACSPEFDLWPLIKVTILTMVTKVAWRFATQSLWHAETHVGLHVK
jgi:hypothetical protein